MICTGTKGLVCCGTDFMFQCYWNTKKTKCRHGHNVSKIQFVQWLGYNKTSNKTTACFEKNPVPSLPTPFPYQAVQLPFELLPKSKFGFFWSAVAPAFFTQQRFKTRVRTCPSSDPRSGSLSQSLGEAAVFPRLAWQFVFGLLLWGPWDSENVQLHMLSTSALSSGHSSFSNISIKT